MKKSNMYNLDMNKYMQFIMDGFNDKNLKILRAKQEVIPGKKIPKYYYQSVGVEGESSIFLGLLDDREYRKGHFVGERAEEDGNYILVGTNGSGKSHFLIKPTLETYADPIVALDFKGELKKHYANALSRRVVKRPFIVWGKREGGTYYEAFAIVRANPLRKVQYMSEIAFALIPKPPDTRDGYWIDMARNFLTAILIYGFCFEMNFIESIYLAQSKSVIELYKMISESNCEDAKMFVRDLQKLKSEQLASITTEMRRHIVNIVADTDIREALSPSEGKEAFSWEQISTDANTPHVFLELEQDRIEQWSGIIRLILTQLIRQLERRPDKHSWEGKRMNPILVLLDEFPLLGKIDAITNALTTLRSRKVHFYLVIQSISQLADLYGENGKSTIMDNCQYKILLAITEPDSQSYFSRLIGKVSSIQFGTSCSYCNDGENLTYGIQMQETRENLIWPEDFATNQDIWLHTPFGFFSTIKLPVSDVRLSEREIFMKIERYKELNRCFRERKNAY